uniref:Secreted protein n=1 Tax=Junco hyemalis TaxID=40217 RepID=A0A8C5JKQ4_JUNHY
MLCVFLAALCALGCESLPSITLCRRAFCWGLSHSSPYPACSKPNDLLSLLWALGKSPHLASGFWYFLTNLYLIHLFTPVQNATQSIFFFCLVLHILFTDINCCTKV